MANFNTYQTRNLYVAKAKKDAANAVTTAGDIYLGTTATGEAFFSYMNADGNLTRSDLIYPKNVKSLKKTAAADMNIKLKQHTVAIDTTKVSLSDLVGKTLTCVVTIHEMVSYDPSDTLTVTAAVVGNSTNTASAAAFHKDLAIAIAKALPKRDFPYLRVFSSGTEVTSKTKAADVTGAAAGVVLVQSPQKWVRGKLSNEPLDFSVAFHLHGSNVEDVDWGTDTVAASTISGYQTIPSAYGLADLEYFTLGERGDYYRGSTWPNNYEPTYMINPADTSTTYDVLSIEYAWQGSAENIQKSPRMIQVAGPAAVVNALYAAVDELVNGPATETEPEEP